jgi:hypothetical protein
MYACLAFSSMPSEIAHPFPRRCELWLSAGDARSTEWSLWDTLDTRPEHSVRGQIVALMGSFESRWLSSGLA